MSLIDKIKNAVSDAGEVIVKGAGDVVKTTIEVAVAPHKSVVDIVTGKSVDEVMKDVQNVVVDHATAVAAAANVRNFVIINTANIVAGQEAGNIAIAATASSVVQNSFFAELAKRVGNPDLKPEDIVKVPLDIMLSTALSSASQSFLVVAKPLPAMVKLALKNTFDKELLNRAKYSVGKVGVTLPQIINGFQSLMGNHEHAVTIPGVIVFSKEPEQDESYIKWWAHELQHIVQYEQLGSDGFASKYISNFKELEDEAHAKANSVSM